MRLLETGLHEIEPLFVCSLSGVVVALNSAARAVAELRRGIFCTADDRLSFTRAGDQTSFQRLLGELAGPTGSALGSRVMRFAVPGEPDPNTIVVARSRHAPGNPSGTSFQVVAHYRQDVFATVPAQLGEIFDLTQAEQGVATAIMKGQRLSNQAKALGLSHETVRWHAKNILAKAGCSSQIEFVRLAMSILRPVG